MQDIMMAPREIRAILKEQPFEGIRIFISDGEVYDVRHPDMVFVTARRIYIAMPPLKDGVPAGQTASVDPLHITRVEPINGKRPPTKKRS